MGRPELGTKCTCTACHERFYDLNRAPAVCPKCGAQQRQEKSLSLRQSRTTFGARLQPRPSPRPVAVEDEVEPLVASDIAADADDADDEVPDDEAPDDIADDDDEVDPALVKPLD